MLFKTLLLGGLLSASAAFAVPASADEVIIRRDVPVEVVPVRPPAAVVVEPRRDCATTTTRRENGLGDSETVTRRECD